MHLLPTKPGYYWAQWRKAAPGTRDGDELTPSEDWEPVQVFENALDDQHPEYLMVEVGGVEKAQSLDGFTWGHEIARPTIDASASLATLGIRLPVRFHPEDRYTVADADGTPICVIDHNSERKDDDAHRITGLLVQMINASATILCNIDEAAR